MGKLQAAQWTAAIAAAAIGVIMTSEDLLAQVSTTPGPGQTPSATENYWTEQRKRDAVPNMPSPAVDPKAPPARNPGATGPVRPMGQPGSAPTTGESR